MIGTGTGLSDACHCTGICIRESDPANESRSWVSSLGMGVSISILVDYGGLRSHGRDLTVLLSSFEPYAFARGSPVTYDKL